jgi:hypothetical protein
MQAYRKLTEQPVKGPSGYGQIALVKLWLDAVLWRSKPSVARSSIGQAALHGGRLPRLDCLEDRRRGLLNESERLGERPLVAGVELDVIAA